MKIKTEKHSTINFNQYWINKAITEGNYQFLPSQKIPGLSIGEYIETRYKAKEKLKQKTYTRR